MRCGARGVPPEKMAEITWVPKQLLEESARLFATTKPACIYRGVASDQLGRAASSVEIARAMLRMLSGNLDVVGGDTMTKPSHPKYVNAEAQLVVRQLHIQRQHTCSRSARNTRPIHGLMANPRTPMQSLQSKRLSAINAVSSLKAS